MKGKLEGRKEIRFDVAEGLRIKGTAIRASTVGLTIGRGTIEAPLIREQAPDLTPTISKIVPRIITMTDTGGTSKSFKR